MRIIKNAIIKSADINDSDRGLLTAWLHLEYEGGLHQGFGGYALYLPKSYTHYKMQSPAGHFIWRCMEIAEVSSWDKIRGKSIRVESDKGGFGGNIIAIGHIIKEDWFNPSEDFKEAI